MLLNHPILESYNLKQKREEILSNFSFLNSNSHFDFISIYKYLKLEPTKYYSSPTFEKVINFLNVLKNQIKMNLSKYCQTINYSTLQYYI